MATSDFRSASGLHMFRSMKAVAVAILATLALSGCGVGSDEYWDGEKLVSSNGEALEMAPGDVPAIGNGAPAQTPGTTATPPAGLRNPGVVALPQDPIPVFEGKPAPQPAPYVDPLLGPAPTSPSVPPTF